MIGHLLTAYTLLLVWPFLAEAQEKRIYNIALGDDWGIHEYRDEEGYIQGFGIDFISEVCQQGLMDCRIVWSPYSVCWQSSKGRRPFAGPGLMAHWFDACSSWVPTVERVHTFAFTMPHMKQVLNYLYVKKGSNFDGSDLKGRTIGFVNGWASSEQCLARQTTIKNNVLDADHIIHNNTLKDLVESLKAGKIDALLSPETGFLYSLRKEVDRLDNSMYCTLTGTAMMARKDSDFIPTWNAAFSKMKGSNVFKQLCERANQKHQHRGPKIDCVD